MRGHSADRPPPPPSAPDRPPAVLVVEHELGESGATRLVLALVAAWRREQVPVQLLALHRGDPEDRAPVPEGVEVLHPARRELRHRGLLTTGLLRCAQLARRADVVVAGREIGWGLLVSRAASWLARRPFVVLVQSEPAAAIDHHVAPRLRPLTRRALTSADRVVCVSPGLVPAAEAIGIDPERISVVLNGVDVEALRSTAPAEESSLPAGEGPLVVAVGRLVRQKGFDVLLRAHAAVVAAGVPHRLLVLGEGDDRRDLEELADALGVRASTHLPGFSDDRFAIVAAADLFCLPSRWEGSPLSLAEAMGLGVPVIAADCVSGPRHLLQDGERGDLVPVDDVEALAAAVERHLRDPARLAGRARTARTWALEHLGVERSAAEVLGVLAQVGSRR